MTGKEIRLARLFSGGRNAVVVAVDHGEFDGPLPGMVDLAETVRRIDPCVSAILLSPGMLPHTAHAFASRNSPVAMVRLNWSTHFCFHWDYREGIAVQAFSPGQAVALGAECVLICLTLRTGEESRDAANVELFCRLAAEAHQLGLPVVGEYFPARPDRLSPEELHDEVMRGSRILAELGADLIKTYCTLRFDEVTAGCPVPVLGLGAEKTPRQLQALELAARIVQGGGRGVVFGRNAVQVPDPPAFQRALCAVVQDGVTPAEAARANGLTDRRVGLPSACPPAAREAPPLSGARPRPPGQALPTCSMRLRVPLVDSGRACQYNQWVVAGTVGRLLFLGPSPT